MDVSWVCVILGVVVVQMNSTFKVKDGETAYRCLIGMSCVRWCFCTNKFDIKTKNPYWVRDISRCAVLGVFFVRINSLLKKFWPDGLKMLRFMRCVRWNFRSNKFDMLGKRRVNHLQMSHGRVLCQVEFLYGWICHWNKKNIKWIKMFHRLLLCQVGFSF